MTFEGLNPNQLEAVVTTEGPLLVLAGAGSGKTKVLTTRVSYLINHCNVEPGNILAITFTNKAALEMRSRIINILGDIAYKIQISTFHSLGLLILKENYEDLGLSKNFTILDSDDSLTIIKKILKDLNIDENPKSIKSAISSNKNELITPIEYQKYVQTDFDNSVYLVYKRYEEKLRLNNSVDFDDLLILPIKLFRENHHILEKYQERFKYVLIDEYQDTNEAQYLITKMIASKYLNICVVGDDSQSIYSWRGSNYKNILNFERDYPNAKVVLLEQNYRSTKKIIDISNKLIKNNKIRKDKNLWTDNEEGNDIHFSQATNEKEEAYFIIKEVRNLLINGVDPNEIAVLYRTNAQARNIEEAFLRENIAYKIVGSFYFYNYKEIKDLIAYLKLIYNPHDEVSLRRIINVPRRKIGEKTLENLTNKAREENTSLYDAITDGKELEFKKMIDELRQAEVSLTELVELVLSKTGLRDEIKTLPNLEAEIKLENLEEFKSIAKQFEDNYGVISLSEFLNELALVADISEYKKTDKAITLMTIHLAKGLEFEYVFIVGLEEGLFPHFNSLQDSNAIEEERRLCYVAITRAKKEVWLLNAYERTLYGIKKKTETSRFIKEINLKAAAQVKVENNINQDADYKIGEHITFDPYGEGVVVAIKDKILTVAFSHPHGLKTLIKGHRKIIKI